MHQNPCRHEPILGGARCTTSHTFAAVVGAGKRAYHGEYRVSHYDVKGHTRREGVSQLNSSAVHVALFGLCRMAVSRWGGHHAYFVVEKLNYELVCSVDSFEKMGKICGEGEGGCSVLLIKYN